MTIEILDTCLPDVKRIKPKWFSDDRGFFMETYSFKNFGIQFCQDNLSHSKHPGTIRGLHYQAPPFAQSKLVSVVKGSILDVAVDIRKMSPTFGKYVCCTLTDENREQLYVPEGFAHGFITLVPDTIVCYKVTNFYSKEHDRGIIWNDEELKIEWPKNFHPVLSDKDQQLPKFLNIESPF